MVASVAQVYKDVVYVDARTFLESVEKADTIIECKLIERQQWMDLALSITANMDGERVQSSGSKDKMGSAVARCIDMVGEIDKAVAKLATVKPSVTAVIEQLYSTMEYKVLHMRYIQYKTLEEIDEHYNKCDGWAKVTCHRATKHVQAILNKR